MKTKEDIAEIVKEVGVKKMLEGLILAIKHEKMEGYEENLKHSLECTLYQYEHRYDE